MREARPANATEPQKEIARGNHFVRPGPGVKIMFAPVPTACQGGRAPARLAHAWGQTARQTPPGSSEGFTALLHVARTQGVPGGAVAPPIGADANRELDDLTYDRKVRRRGDVGPSIDIVRLALAVNAHHDAVALRFALGGRIARACTACEDSDDEEAEGLGCTRAEASHCFTFSRHVSPTPFTVPRPL